MVKELKGVNVAEAIMERIFVRCNELDVPVLCLDHLLMSKKAVGEDKDLADIAALKRNSLLP